MLANTLKVYAGDHKKLFRALHCAIGYDFNKPYSWYTIDGKFTINSLKKKINYDPNKKTVALIKPLKGYNAEEIYCIEITPDGYTIDIPSKYYFSYNSAFDTFYRKVDVETIRKQDHIKTIVICQNEKYLSNTDRKVLSDFFSDPFERYIPGNIIGGLCKDVHYISQLELTPIYYNGKKFDYKSHGQVIYTNQVKSYPKNVSDIIDKSGYYVFSRRNELKQKAKKAYANKEKQKLIEHDFSVEISVLDKKRKKAIQLLSEKALTISSYEQMKHFAEKTNRIFSGLEYIYHAHDLFIQRINNNYYTSVESALNVYREINMKYIEFISEWEY